MSCRLARPWLILMAALTLTVPLIGCASTPAASADHPAYSAIRAANDAMQNRWASRDFLGVAAMYADDAVMLTPRGDRIAGRAAIDDYWTSNREGRTDLSWDLTIDSLEGVGDLVVQRGRSTLRSTTADGDRRTSIVEFMLVWTRRESAADAWRIAVDAYWSP